MIVVDTSALIAVLRLEPDAAIFSASMSLAQACLLSAISLQAASMVLVGRVGTAGDWYDLDALIDQVGIEVVPHDEPLAQLARDAFLRFGKGRHPAALNLCDCASYALAKQRGAPLLYKGRDFARTDIASAVTP